MKQLKIHLLTQKIVCPGILKAILHEERPAVSLLIWETLKDIINLTLLAQTVNKKYYSIRHASRLWQISSNPLQAVSNYFYSHGLPNGISSPHQANKYWFSGFTALIFTSASCHKVWVEIVTSHIDGSLIPIRVVKNLSLRRYEAIPNELDYRA